MTLVEVLVAGAILVFGMVGVIAVLGAASRSHKQAIDETLATFVATSVLSEMRAKFAVGVELKTTQQEEHPDYPGYRTAVRVIELTKGREYFVELKVLWGPRDEPRTIIFNTIMFLRPTTP